MIVPIDMECSEGVGRRRRRSAGGDGARHRSCCAPRHVASGTWTSSNGGSHSRSCVSSRRTRYARRSWPTSMVGVGRARECRYVPWGLRLARWQALSSAAHDGVESCAELCVATGSCWPNCRAAASGRGATSSARVIAASRPRISLPSAGRGPRRGDSSRGGWAGAWRAQGLAGNDRCEAPARGASVGFRELIVQCQPRWFQDVAVRGGRQGQLCS